MIAGVGLGVFLFAPPAPCLGQDGQRPAADLHSSPPVPQESPALEPGDRLRLSLVAEPEVIGTFVTADSDRLTLDIPDGGDRHIEVASIMRLERSLGVHRQADLWPAVGIGAAGGAMLGLIGAGLSSLQAEGADGPNTGVYLAIGAALGAAAGAIIGSGPEQEQWQELPLRMLRVGFDPRDGRGWIAAASLRL